MFFKKIFITGGTGFVGSHLVKKLAELGNEIVVLVREKSDTSMIDKLNVTKAMGDICFPETYREYLKNIDIVYHLAGIVTDWALEEEYQKINVEATEKLLTEAEKNNVGLFVYVSSSVVSEKNKVIDENSNYRNFDFGYIGSKIRCEKLISEFNKKHRLSTAIIRPVWVYGSGDKVFLPEIIKQINNQYVFLVGNKKNNLPLIYIDNLVDILIKLGNLKLGGMETFLAADCEYITWERFIKLISNSLNKPVKVIFVPYHLAYFVGYCLEVIYRLFNGRKRPLLTRTSVEMLGADIRVNNSKLFKNLGYRQKIDLMEGIERTIKDIKCLS